MELQTCLVKSSNPIENNDIALYKYAVDFSTKLVLYAFSKIVKVFV